MLHCMAWLNNSFITCQARSSSTQTRQCHRGPKVGPGPTQICRISGFVKSNIDGENAVVWSEKRCDLKKKVFTEMLTDFPVKKKKKSSGFTCWFLSVISMGPLSSSWALWSRRPSWSPWAQGSLYSYVFDIVAKRHIFRALLLDISSMWVRYQLNHLLVVLVNSIGNNLINTVLRVILSWKVKLNL